jgi:predicted GNAT superfamily acetyltransferase
VRWFTVLLLFALVLSGQPSHAIPPARSPEADRKTLLALEDEWLHARDAATLERILADDFVHPLPQGVFLSKAEHIDWFVKHLPRADRKTRLDQVRVRIYGDTAVVDGMVLASDESGKEIGRTVFTDVFVYREGRWQAVNAQENEVNR